MRKITYFIALLIVLLTYSCKKDKAPKVNSKVNDSIKANRNLEHDSVEVFIVDTLSGDTDTIMLSDSIKVISLPIDREEKAKAERAKAQLQGQLVGSGTMQQTADQAFFDVKGHVKSITYKNGFALSYNQVIHNKQAKDVVSFTRDGKWIPSSGYVVKRDAQGRIKSLKRKKDNIHNEVTWSGTKPLTIKMYDEEEGKNTYCVAHLQRSNGYVTGYKAEICLRGDKDTEKVNGKVLKRDAKGNWTKRRFKAYQDYTLEERTIEYY